MLGKLLSFGKKKDSFYLELKEDNSDAVAEIAPPKAATTEVAKVESKTVDTAPATPAKAATESKQETAPATKSKEAETQQAVPSPVAIDTSYSEEPFWVKLMYKSSEQKAAETQTEKTFATDYLVAKPRPSRRPGGSIDKFKDMARQTKVKF